MALVAHQLTVARFTALQAHHDSLVDQLARTESAMSVMKVEGSAGHRAARSLKALVTRRADLKNEIREINRTLRTIEWEGEGILHGAFVSVARSRLSAPDFDAIMSAAHDAVEQARLAKDKPRRRSGRASMVVL